MNRTHEELKVLASNDSALDFDNTELKWGPEIGNLEGKNCIQGLQEANTYSLFWLERGGWAHRLRH